MFSSWLEPAHILWQPPTEPDASPDVQRTRWMRRAHSVEERNVGDICQQTDNYEDYQLLVNGGGKPYGRNIS